MLLDVKMFKKQNLIHYGRWVNQKPTQSENPHLHCNYGVISNLEILNLLLFISSASLASHYHHHCVLSNNLPVFLELLFPHILVGHLYKTLHLLFSIWFLLSQFLLLLTALVVYPFSPAQPCLCTSLICSLPNCWSLIIWVQSHSLKLPMSPSQIHLRETSCPT